MSFNVLLDSFSNTPIQLIAPDVGLESYLPIDLSISNNDFDAIDSSCSDSFSIYINQYLQQAKKEIAYGGYLEHRKIYQRSKHFNDPTTKNQRNIHLGIDLWYAANTPVMAAFDGTIHSFKNNRALGDYGPTIILEHRFSGIQFFTLYGHLSLESIQNLTIGSSVKSGDCIGFLGDRAVNGDYPPHLHFQVIRDIQGHFGDYPGVCSLSELEFYKANCPDPNSILKLK